MTDTSPELGTLKVGDPVIVIPYRNRNPDGPNHIEATVTKVARLFVTLTETNQVSSLARTWRMRVSTQREDSNYSYYDRFVTPAQHAWQQRLNAASTYLAEVGVSIDSRSLYRNDMSFRITLANLIRAHFNLDPI